MKKITPSQSLRSSIVTPYWAVTYTLSFLFLSFFACKKEVPAEEIPPCEAQVAVSEPLEGIWATTKDLTKFIWPTQCFVHQNTLIVFESRLQDASITALDLKTGNLIWGRALPRQGVGKTKPTGDKMFYAVPQQGESFYFDFSTLSEQSVFQKPNSDGYMNHVFAALGDWTANVTTSIDPSTDSVIARIYLSNIKNKQIKQLHERHYGPIFAINNEAFPSMDFAIAESGDTLLCFIEALGLYASSSGSSKYWYEFQSINLRNNQRRSGPAFQGQHSANEENLLVCQSDVYYHTDSEIHCLNAGNGQMKWKASASSPLLICVKDKLFAFESSSCTAFDSQNGKRIWSEYCSTDDQPLLSTAYAFDEDHLYLAAATRVVKFDQKFGCIVGRYSNPYSDAPFFNQAVLSPDGQHLYVSSLNLHSQHFGFKKP